MEMSKMKRCAIMGIMQAPNLQQKEMIYESFEKLLKDCRIILFDQKCSNFGESFSNKKITGSKNLLNSALICHNM